MSLGGMTLPLNLGWREAPMRNVGASKERRCRRSPGWWNIAIFTSHKNYSRPTKKKLVKLTHPGTTGFFALPILRYVEASASWLKNAWLFGGLFLEVIPYTLLNQVLKTPRFGNPPKRNAQPQIFCGMGYPENNITTLRINGWKTTFLLERPIFHRRTGSFYRG